MGLPYKLLNSLEQPLLVPIYTRNQIRVAALRERIYYEQVIGDGGPIPDLEGFIWDDAYWSQNLRLVTDEVLGETESGDQILGYTLADETGGDIYIDNQVASSARYLQTLAHEYGHWILHRQWLRYTEKPAHLTRKQIQGFPQPLCNCVFVSGAEVERYLDWQANRFAEEFLMPQIPVRSSFVRRYKLPAVTPRILIERGLGKFVNSNKTDHQLSLRARRYITLRLASMVSSEFPTSIAEEFGVSTYTMARRLWQLSLLADVNSQPRPSHPLDSQLLQIVHAVRHYKTRWFFASARS
jgi:Zn-dependent peptidase ImmA (M78 family)